MVEKRFYTLDEAAEMLGLSEDELNDRAKKGEIRGFRDTGGFKFKVELIDELVANGSVKPAEAAADDDLMPLDDDDLVELDAEETVDLDGDVLEDDDLVLGGSGTGSGITLGGDSGISLVDPADSGLSLEEPLELAQSEESLELGEDEMFSLSDDTDTEAPAELKAEDEFLLDTLEVTEDEDVSESGSQVIALDDAADDAAGDMADDMAGDMAGDAAATIDNTPMAGILEEDLDAEPNELGLTDGLDAAATGSPLGPQPGVGTAGEPSSQAAASMPETPYSIWNILSLALCVIFLVMTGMMMSDLLRNMWSWDSAYEFNSTIMDTILGWFE